MRIATLGLVIALGLTPVAFAQSAPDAFDDCAREKDATRRLACFDLQVAARQAARSAVASGRAVAPPVAAVPAVPAAPAAPVAAAPKPAAPAVPAATPAPATAAAAASSDVGLDARQIRKLHPERADTTPTTVTGTVVKVIPRRPLISAFELDTGQVWEQTETLDGLLVRPQDAVTITAGIMGGFLMKTADGHVVRVHRLK